MTDLKDIRLNTINGITDAIQAMLGKQEKTGEKPSPLMLDVFEAVIEQIEAYGGFDGGIDKAMTKVRQRLGLPPKKEEKKPEAPEALQ